MPRCLLGLNKRGSQASQGIAIGHIQYQELNKLCAACRVAARDSGKPMVDAAFGELMVTCEKAAWLADQGERYLRTEWRQPGLMVRFCGHSLWNRD
jgi:hypothetical protein